MKTAKSLRHRVLLIEPSAIIAQGLRALLGEHAQFGEITLLSDPGQGMESLARLEPGLILVNPAVWEYSRRMGVRALSPLLREAVLVAVLSAPAGDEELSQYDAHINLYDDPAHIVQTLRQALHEGAGHPAPEDKGGELSAREQEILVAVARGLTNKEIAEQHHISVYTVISHRKNISRKTGIKSVSGLTIYALLHKLIDGGSLMPE